MNSQPTGEASSSNPNNEQESIVSAAQTEAPIERPVIPHEPSLIFPKEFSRLNALPRRALKRARLLIKKDAAKIPPEHRKEWYLATLNSCEQQLAEQK